MAICAATRADAFAPTSTVTASNQRPTTTSTSTSMFANEDDDAIIESSTRRDAIQQFGSTTLCLLLASAAPADALDFDSFISQEIEKDVSGCDPKLDRKCIPKLNDDEALCKYGGAGGARADACRRVRDAGGQLPTSKPGDRKIGGWFVPDTS